MKNRLLAYGFGTPQPSTPKKSTPAKKPRQRKGKRLICRILDYFDEDDGNPLKLCIYVAGPGEYYIGGQKVSAKQALRGYLVRRFEGREIVDDFIDEREMKILKECVLPYEKDLDDCDQEDDGEDWKTA